jgi:hypothetical protein
VHGQEIRGGQAGAQDPVGGARIPMR